jgi:myo-inositol catabolism protein IolH
MKISLDPAMLNEEPIDAVAPAVAQAGYHYLELPNRPDFIPAFAPLKVQPATIRGFASQLDDNGVELSSVAIIQNWASPDHDVRSEAVEQWRRALDCAAALGCFHVNSELSGDPCRNELSRSAWLRSLEELADDIEAGGFTLSVEPHPNDFEEHARPAIALIREAGRPWLRYLHCTAHTFHLAASTSEALREAGDLVDHIHLADSLRPERIIMNPPRADVRIHEHLDFGQGEVDWDDVFDGILSTGFDGILTVQVFAWADRARESFARNQSALIRYLGKQETQ